MSNLENSRFVCFPATGDSVLRESPQSVMSSEPELKSTSISRRMQETMNGVLPDNFVGVFNIMDRDFANEFLQEPRSGVIEKAMANHISEVSGGGPKENVVSVENNSSPIARAKQKLSSFKPLFKK